jgi:hypothetical protein
MRDPVGTRARARRLCAPVPSFRRSCRPRAGRTAGTQPAACMGPRRCSRTQMRAPEAYTKRVIQILRSHTDTNTNHTCGKGATAAPVHSKSESPTNTSNTISRAQTAERDTRTHVVKQTRAHEHTHAHTSGAANIGVPPRRIAGTRAATPKSDNLTDACRDT